MSTAQAVGGLPREATSFVGRHRELAEARRQMFLGRLTTLTGPGGVGKSRLALRLARKVRRAFPDGVVLVDLADLQDAALLPQQVAAAFGIATSAGDPTAELLGRITAARLLVVLDHCDHVLAAAARFVRDVLTSAPEARVLATSRQALGLAGERVLRVAPLSVPPPGAPAESATHVFSDAVRLFADRAAAVCPGFRLDEDNRDVVVRICRRVEGMPLAIELAAARLAESSPHEVLRRLDDRFAVLAREGDRSRNDALAESIGWSFELCAPAEQLLWRRLSAFRGEFDRTAAEEVCAAPPLSRERVAELLEVLVAKSIVLREEHGGRAYYRMFDSIREYGANRLLAAGRREAVRDRHREYVHRLARRYCDQQFGPQQLDWIEHLAHLHPNIRVVLERDLHDAVRAREALRSAVRLWPYWFAGNALREGRMWLRRGLAVVDGPPELRADGLGACAFLNLQLNRLQEARRQLDEATELLALAPEPGLRSRITGVRGVMALFDGRPAEAADLVERAGVEQRAAGDLYGYANAMILLSRIGFALGDPRGPAAAAAALRLCEERGATWTKSYALWAVALHRWAGGDLREATLLLQQAVRLQRSARDTTGLSYYLEVLSWCAAATDQPHRTAHLAGAAEALRRISGGRTGNASSFEEPDHGCSAWARQVLGEEEFARAFAEGAGWSVPEIVAYVLGEGAAGLPG